MINSLFSMRVKYTALFMLTPIATCIAAYFISLLVTSLEATIDHFVDAYTPANKAVLSLENELYQMRLNENGAIGSGRTKKKLAGLQENIDAHANQVIDLLKEYRFALESKPDLLKNLNGFDKALETWRGEINSVFELSSGGRLIEAIFHYNNESQSAFETMLSITEAANQALSARIDAERLSANGLVETFKSQAITFNVLLVTLSALLAIFIPRNISRSIALVTQSMVQLLQGDGDLTRKIKTRRRDEIGGMIKQVNLFVGHLAQMMVAIQSSSHKVEGEMNTLQQASEKSQQYGEQQKESIEEIVVSIQKISNNSTDVAEQADETANLMKSVDEIVKSGHVTLDKTTHEIQMLKDSLTTGSEYMGSLLGSSKKISSILDVIRGVAEQTNLLALNASIEAARAGEMGRGFAVVADEIRMLANKTQESTEDIQNMISTIQGSVEKAADNANSSLKMVQDTVEIATEVKDKFDHIQSSTAAVKESSAYTANLMELQNQDSSQLNDNLTFLSNKTENLYSLYQELSLAINQTIQNSHDLNDQISHFKTE